jgi:hypothetical protein
MRRIILVVTVSLVIAAMTTVSASLAATARAALIITAPAAPVISSPPEGSYDNDGAFTLSGTAPTDSYVKVFEVLDNGMTSHRGTVQASAAGEWALPLQGVVGEGKHAYKARATDQYSKVSNWSNTRTVILDTIAPKAPTLLVGSDRHSFENTVKDGNFGGKAEAGSKVEVFLQDVLGQETLISTASSDSLGNWSTPAVFSLNNAKDANYFFKARATDRAGNVSGWSNNIQINVDCLSEGCPVARGRG